MSNSAPVDSRRRLLVLTYAFPPVAYVGVYRTLKYCRYLPSYGWDASVVTAKPSATAHVDEALCKQVPERVNVRRTFDIDPAKWLEKLAGARKRSRSRGGVQGSPIIVSEEAAVRQKPLRSVIKKTIVRLLTGSPDSHVWWVPFAFLAGARFLLARRADIIFSTSPPHSTHLAAVLLSKVFRIPLVVDFRDPWSLPTTGPAGLGNDRPAIPLEAWMKRVTVTQASHVFAVSQGERDDLRAEFPQMAKSKFSFITNGFDSADFPVADRDSVPSAQMVFAHTGTLYSGAAGSFFDALRELFSERPELVSRVRLNFAGSIADEYAGVIGDLEAIGVLRRHGMVPHQEALLMMQSSDVLVVLLGGSFGPAELPAKVFEYLFVGKPILTVAGEGELANIVRQSGLGIVVAPQSKDAIKQAVIQLLQDQDGPVREWRADAAFVSQFARPTLAKQLADVLDSVLDSANQERTT